MPSEMTKQRKNMPVSGSDCFYYFIFMLPDLTQQYGLKQSFRDYEVGFFALKMQETVAQLIMSCCLCQLGSVMIF